MNRHTRDRLVLPLLIPVGVFALIGALVVGFSRILLSVSTTAATVTAITVAAGILATAAAVAARPIARFSSLLSMLTAVAGVALLAGGLALAATGPGGPRKAGPVGGGAPAGPVVSLSASPGAASTGFDQTTLSAPADTAFVVRFDNQDPGVPHRVGIYADEGYTRNLFEGDIVTGPAPIDYRVDPLKAGTYYFRCEIHPTTMTGTIDVTAAGGGGPTATPPGGTPTAGPTAAPGGGGGAIDVTARGLAFDTSRLTLPAGGTVTIRFTNDDAGIPHNIAIYSADPATDPSAQTLFKGDLVTGPGGIDYTFPAPPPGTFYFQCDVHPTTMNGTVTVG